MGAFLSLQLEQEYNATIPGSDAKKPKTVGNISGEEHHGVRSPWGLPSAECGAFADGVGDLTLETMKRCCAMSGYWISLSVNLDTCC